MDVVQESPRVTAGDVASRAGVSVQEAEQALQVIAGDTQGTLQVSDDGDVVYILPDDYRQRLLAKSLALRLEPAIAKAASVSGYVGRVSFGTALFVSLLVVYAAIFAITTASSSDEERRSYGYRPMFYISPFDFLWFWDPFYYGNAQAKIERGERLNFLEAVFSFVFGDGNPNLRLEEARYQAIGALAKANGGVLTAEQLAPYMEPPPRPNDELLYSDEYKSYFTLDENFVLPALQRFGGVADVTETGDLVYRFPALQRTTAGEGGSMYPSSQDGLNMSVQSGAFLQESEIQFTAAEAGQVTMTVLLGVANLVGVLILSSLLGNPSPQVAKKMGTGLIGFATFLLPFLKAYALSFFIIPLVRWLLNRRKNAQIRARNEVRESYAEALRVPDEDLARKLAAARQLSYTKVITDKDIMFSSGEGAEDAEKREFDRRLNDM